MFWTINDVFYLVCPPLYFPKLLYFSLPHHESLPDVQDAVIWSRGSFRYGLSSSRSTWMPNRLQIDVFATSCHENQCESVKSPEPSADHTLRVTGYQGICCRAASFGAYARRVCPNALFMCYIMLGVNLNNVRSVVYSAQSFDIRVLPSHGGNAKCTWSCDKTAERLFTWFLLLVCL